MKLTAEIVVREHIADIEKVFIAEEAEFKNQRASYDLKKEKDKLVFLVTASDSVALRAVLNSITKILTVYEKAHGVTVKELPEE